MIYRITWVDGYGDTCIDIYEGEEIEEYLHWLKDYINDYDLTIERVDNEWLRRW